MRSFLLKTAVIAKILNLSLFGIWLASPAFGGEAVGSVVEMKGSAKLYRGETSEIELKGNDFVRMEDEIETSLGEVGIEFEDETQVFIGENSYLFIDEFVYDPATGTGEVAIDAAFGTLRYISGKIAENSKEDVIITTPTASVTVRGTHFTVNVSELGDSNFVLLPECDRNGKCKTGEISITPIGIVIDGVDLSAEETTVVLNQANQSVSIDSSTRQPETFFVVVDEIASIETLTPLSFLKPQDLLLGGSNFQAINEERLIVQQATLSDSDNLFSGDDLSDDQLSEGDDLSTDGLLADCLETNCFEEELETATAAKTLVPASSSQASASSSDESDEVVEKNVGDEIGSLIINESSDEDTQAQINTGASIAVVTQTADGVALLNFSSGSTAQISVEASSSSKTTDVAGGGDNIVNIVQQQ
ncbi:FecR family protein [Paracoccaceae bacterium]|nr:FecR family protein [Paracoccaceae bacterium]